MSYTSKRFAVRTIKDGRVTIGGVTFAPKQEHARGLFTQQGEAWVLNGFVSKSVPVPYTGQLDGQRWAFGRYDKPGGEGFEPYVSLWGSAKAFAFQGDVDTASDDEHDWPGANCIDGVFHWEWWDAVEERGND